MNKIWVTALYLALTLLVKPALGLAVPFQKGVANTSILLGPSDLVRVSVKTIELPDGYPYSKAYRWGGDEVSPPKRIIETLEVVRKNHTVRIPLSAFVDLGNPRIIELVKLPSHGYRLIIRGGDAAGSYTACLDFRSDEIVQRKVTNSEFPKEVWEKTVFSFNHLNN